MSLNVNLTNTKQPEFLSPLITDGIGNWFEFTGSITGGSYSINDANLFVDVLILDPLTLTVSQTPGRFKLPCRENGKFIFNPENIVKNFVTYPYNSSTPRYYNGYTYSNLELVADPWITTVPSGSTATSLTNYNRSYGDFLLSTTYSIGGSSLSGRNLKTTVPSYGTGLTINVLTVGGIGQITSSSIATSGSGYTIDETFEILAGGVGTNATGVVNTVGPSGNVLTYTITSPGSGFTALSTRTTNATSGRTNYLEIYGNNAPGGTNSYIFEYEGLYTVQIDYAVEKPASAPPLQIDFTMNYNTVSKTHSISGSYSFVYEYYSPGVAISSSGTPNWGLFMKAVPTNATNSHVYYFHSSVKPTSLTNSTTPLYVNESTPIGLTSTNFPNFSYDFDSYVPYSLSYGLEFNPEQRFIGVTAIAGLATFISLTNSILTGDVITTLPDSTLFSYFSTTSTSAGTVHVGSYYYTITDLPYVDPLTITFSGSFTSVQRTFGTTSTIFGYNGVRDYLQKDSSLTNKFDMVNYRNNSFLSNYGYDEYHCIPIKPGQGERARLATRFCNELNGGSNFQLFGNVDVAGGPIATYSITPPLADPGASYSVGQILRIDVPSLEFFGFIFSYTQSYAWFEVTNVDSTGAVTDGFVSYPGLGYGFLGYEYPSTDNDFNKDSRYTITMIDTAGNETLLLDQVLHNQLPGLYTKGIFSLAIFDEYGTIPIYDGYKYRVDYYAFRFQFHPSASLWYIGVVDCPSTGYTNTRIKFLDKNGSWAYANFSKDKKETNNITRTEYRTPLSYDYSLNPSVSGYSVEKLTGTNIISVQEQKTFTLNSDWIDEDYYAYLVDNLLPSRKVFEFYDSYSFSDGSTASAVNIPINITSNNVYKRTLNRDKVFNIVLDYKYSNITTQNI